MKIEYEVFGQFDIVAHNCYKTIIFWTMDIANKELLPWQLVEKNIEATGFTF